jgi:hypothetical protein
VREALRKQVAGPAQQDTADEKYSEDINPNRMVVGAAHRAFKCWEEELEKSFHCWALSRGAGT